MTGTHDSAPLDATALRALQAPVPDGSDACSGDMLLEALLACAGVTLRSVATSTERYCVVGQSLREPVRIVLRGCGSAAQP